MVLINSAYESTGLNRMYNLESLQCLLVLLGTYLGHTRPHQSQAYFHMQARGLYVKEQLRLRWEGARCWSDVKFRIELCCQISSKVIKKNQFLFQITDVVEFCIMDINYTMT